MPKASISTPISDDLNPKRAHQTTLQNRDEQFQMSGQNWKWLYARRKPTQTMNLLLTRGR
jgi:hypothetical protein